MMLRISFMLSVFILGLAGTGFSQIEEKTNMTKNTTTSQNPTVLIKTSMGDIKVELYSDKAPKTVENFLEYVRDGHYEDTIFHRIIDGFMIQGGGFTVDFKQKPTDPAVQIESDNGLKNTRGTLAMARTSDPNSATSQFFINLVNNSFLDFKSKTPTGYGYTVFGKVVSGMDVVDKIAKVKTGSYQGHKDVPLEPVIILSVSEVTAENANQNATDTTK